MNGSGVTYTEVGGELIVKVATSGPPRFKAFALKGPDRLVVDVLEAEWNDKLRALHEAQEELEVEFSGDPLDVGFNVTYLLDVLNNVSTGKVVCSFGDANSSMLITLPGRDDFRYVVMPMRI